MSDSSSAYVAYLTAQQRTAAFAREALPGAAPRPAPVAAVRGDRQGLVRHRVSLVLRRLAELVEPTPGGGKPAVAGRR